MTAPTSVGAAERALDEVRARLRGHGGDVRVVAVDESGEAELEFVGACNGCPAIAFTFTAVVEPALVGRAGVRSVRSRQVKASEYVLRRVRALSNRSARRAEGCG
jgi:Fe-S cluster biogenesis protein NfuA